MPSGEVGREKEGGESDEQAKSAAGPVNRLTAKRGDDEQERHRKAQAPEAGGDGADATQADQPWAECQRAAADDQRQESKRLGP